MRKIDLDILLKEGGDKIELHECDLTDRMQVNVAANGADTLINAIDFHNEYANNSHYEVSVMGAQNIGWTARCARCERVINCNGLDATMCSESNWIDMRARGEEAIGCEFTDACLLRFGPLYGNGYRFRGAGRFIYPCTFCKTRCQPTWVRDAARMVVRACFAQRMVRAKLDLGGPEVMTHLQFVRKMSNLYHPRLIFPFPPSVGKLASRFTPWLIPNPWFDDNWIYTYELDRSPVQSGGRSGRG